MPASLNFCFTRSKAAGLDDARQSVRAFCFASISARRSGVTVARAIWRPGRATVYVYVGSAAESRSLPRPQEGELTGLFRFSTPAEPSLRKRLPFQLRVLGQARIHLGGKWTRSNAVRRDPFR